MAVFTPVSESELNEFLSSYDIGTLISFQGIEQGVSNTNYFLTTTQARFVLTLFEPRRVRAEDVPFFLKYAACLEQSGIPCPRTMTRKDGSDYALLCARPAAIFSVLEGEGGDVGMLNAALCGKGGAILARMHVAAGNIKETSPNRFGVERWQKWVGEIGASVSGEFEWISSRWPYGLPSGAIHGDYFPDNVFFRSGDITGVFDFHFVCTDLFAYDLAIACNAWCFDEKNEFRAERMDGFMRGYRSLRPLTGAEEEALPVLLRAAALRFLLSRIEEKNNWKQGDFMVPHDPAVFEKRLKHFQRIDT